MAHARFGRVFILGLTALALVAAGVFVGVVIGKRSVLSPAGLETLASRKYEQTPAGKMVNGDRIWLVWVGPDEFIYVPDPDRPFHFIRADGERIEPGAMKTDGGSIPRALRISAQYSPWRFTPAFMLHDWLFEMKHCKKPGGENHTVKSAADVMAECVKTQMETDADVKNATTLYLMDVAVREFAGKLWDEGTCEMVDDTQIQRARTILDIAREPGRALPPVTTGPTTPLLGRRPQAKVQLVPVPPDVFLKARLRRPTTSGDRTPFRRFPDSAAPPPATSDILVPVIHVNAPEQIDARVTHNLG